jgi:hypothetical protein
VTAISMRRFWLRFSGVSLGTMGRCSPPGDRVERLLALLGQRRGARGEDHLVLQPDGLVDGDIGPLADWVRDLAAGAGVRVTELLPSLSRAG